MFGTYTLVGFQLPFVGSSIDLKIQGSRGACSTVVGIISLLVEIGLIVPPKTKGAT